MNFVETVKSCCFLFVNWSLWMPFLQIMVQRSAVNLMSDWLHYYLHKELMVNREKILFCIHCLIFILSLLKPKLNCSALLCSNRSQKSFSLRSQKDLPEIENRRERLNLLKNINKSKNQEITFRPWQFFYYERPQKSKYSVFDMTKWIVYNKW